MAPHAAAEHQHCSFSSFVPALAGTTFILTTIIGAAITITALIHPSFATALAQAGGSPAVAVLKAPFIETTLTMTQFKVATVARATVTGPAITGATVAATTIFGAAVFGCLGW